MLDYDKRPLWYDVYEAFPPIREPIYKPDPGPNEVGLPDVKDDVRPILYAEDWARAIAYERITVLSNADLDPKSDLNKARQRTNFNQRFVEIYKNLAVKEPDLPRNELFLKTERLFAPELLKLKEENRIKNLKLQKDLDVDVEKELSLETTNQDTTAKWIFDIDTREMKKSDYLKAISTVL